MQVYAASIMFGYFLRRVDKRFQLEASLGTLPLSKEDAVARLELLFSAVRMVWESSPLPLQSGSPHTLAQSGPQTLNS